MQSTAESHAIKEKQLKESKKQNEDLIIKATLLESKIEEITKDNTSLVKEYTLVDSKFKEYSKDNSELSRIVSSVNEEVLKIIKIVTEFTKAFKKQAFSIGCKETVYQLERFITSFSEDINTIECMILISKWLDFHTSEVKVNQLIRKDLMKLRLKKSEEMKN
jgi:hypothetical protein